MNFFEANSVTVLTWPALSPDLVLAVYKDVKAFSTIEDLKCAIKRYWDSISTDVIISTKEFWRYIDVRGHFSHK